MSDRLSPLQTDPSFEATKRLAEKIFRDGAEMFCPLCPRKSFKSPEEMAVYMLKWPKCTGTKEWPHKRIAAEVRLPK